MLNFDFECNKLSPFAKSGSARCAGFSAFSVFSILSINLYGAAAPTDYYNHVVFDNSITPDYLLLQQWKGGFFPAQLSYCRERFGLKKRIFFHATDDLRLHWRSVAGGSWETELRVVSMPTGRRSFAATPFTSGAIRRRPFLPPICHSFNWKTSNMISQSR